MRNKFASANTFLCLTVVALMCLPLFACAPNSLSSGRTESHTEGPVICESLLVFDMTANKVIISINEPFVKGKSFLMKEHLPNLVLDLEPSPEWLAIEKQLADYFANKSQGEISGSSTIVEIVGKEYKSGLSGNTWYDSWVNFPTTFKSAPNVLVTGYTRHGEDAHLEDPANRDTSDGVKTNKFCWRFQSSPSGTSGIHWRALGEI